MNNNVFRAATFLGFGAILALGCSESTGTVAEPGPASGYLQISVATVSGSGDLDPDGYILIIDDSPARLVDVNASLIVTGLLTGVHQARLDGVAPKCTVSGDNPRSVYVGTYKAPADPVSFFVSCGETSGGGEWDY